MGQNMAIDLGPSGSERSENKNEEGTGGDLYDLKTKRKKNKAEQLKKGDIRQNLASVMDHEGISNWPKFPYNFKCIEDDRGVRVPLLISEGRVCSYYSLIGVRNAIMQYAKHDLALAGVNIDMSDANAKDFAAFWLGTTKPIKLNDIEMIAQKKDDVLCWRRLPFDLDFDEFSSTPTFNEMFKRFSNASALKAFIGSLFFKEADRQQYLWLYGEGRTGKSSLATFLREILGEKTCVDARIDKSQPNQFWTSSLADARLVLFAECENAAFVKSGLFKSLTGNDAVPMERKGEALFSGKLICKFLFYSNERPGLGSSSADRRRVMYCVADQFDETLKIPPNVYHRKLLAEAPAFLGECYNLYLKLCPDHGEIPTANEHIESLISENEQHMAVFFEGFIEKSHDEFFLPKDLEDRFDQKGIKWSQERSRYIRFLKHHYDVEKTNLNPEKQWRYVGARMKDKPEPIVSCYNSNQRYGD